MTYPVKSPRKLIEVALPLDAINVEASRRKRKAPAGYPTSLHKWWAQRPLAATRAVIFAQLVNDPGFQQGGGFRYGKNRKEAAAERKRLFALMEELILWDNTSNEGVLERAREEIRRSWREVCELNKDHPNAAELFNPAKMPALHDPFAGGGSIPVEAVRLGLNVEASDLNPIAVLINKAMIEFPPQFAGRSPVGPCENTDRPGLSLRKAWPGTAALAEDVRRYGVWIFDEAHKRIGDLYAPVEVTAAMARGRDDLKPLIGKRLQAIAWLWARTVKSPSPAFSHATVPLVSTFILSNKAGKEVYVEPVIERDRYRFVVRLGSPPASAKQGTSAGKRAAFRCLLSDVPIDYNYIRAEGKASRMGVRLLAIVAEGPKGRVFLDPTEAAEATANSAQATWKPEMALPDNTRDFKTPNYGLATFGDLFTPRQLVALTTLSDLVCDVRARVQSDSLRADTESSGGSSSDSEHRARAYADAVAVFLSFVFSRVLHYSSTICAWLPKDSAIARTFTKQAIPMTWDFAEGSVFGKSSVGWLQCCEVVAQCIENLATQGRGHASLADAAAETVSQHPLIISTDPPYYDNVGYADLSDYFYVWLRKALRPIIPELFATLAVPKAEELVATPYRHGSKERAEAFFLHGMTRVMTRLAERSHPAFPATIYYAYKQSETREDQDTSSTGWETFLEAVVQAGFRVAGTWPMRTEGDNRQIGMGNNALASSIVLVCRKRPHDAPAISRREFIRELNAGLPEALDEMTKGSGEDRSPVAPVDLSQAIIGPGMAVFSKYSAVLEADGKPMTVQTALQLINRFLAEADFDQDTQFCLHWFDQVGWSEGRFGEADTLARAKGTSVDGVRRAGVLESGRGVVRLLKWSEYPVDWDPSADPRNPVWETLHHLIRSIKHQGEGGAGRLLAAVRSKGEAARQLAYRLYTMCERKNWAEDARVYNEIITSWSGIEAAAGTASTEPVQGKLFD